MDRSTQRRRPTGGFALFELVIIIGVLAAVATPKSRCKSHEANDLVVKGTRNMEFAITSRAMAHGTVLVDAGNDSCVWITRDGGTGFTLAGSLSQARSVIQ